MRNLAVVLGCVLTAASGYAQTAELVENGSFEAWDAGVPVGWKANVDTLTEETGGAPEGERWVRVAKPEGATHMLIHQRREVKPDTGYRLRAYIRAPRPSHYSLVAYNRVMNTIASHATGWAAMEDWRELELDFRTGPEDYAMSVGLLAFGPEVHWDAVRMWEDDSVRIGDLSPTINERAEPTEVERDRGFMVFGREYNDFVGARYAPTRRDCQTPIRGTCPPGEFVTIVVGVHALRDLTNLHSELITPTRNSAEPAPRVEAELLQIGHSRRALNSQAWRRYPLLLLPPHEVDVAAGETLQYAVRVRVPADYPEPRAPLALRLLSEGKPTHIQVLADVQPVRLDPADPTFFMYYSDSYLPPEVATAPMQAAYYRDMAAHGMNSVSLYVVPEAEVGDGFALDLHHDLRYPPGDVRHSLGMAERIAQMRAAGLTSPERPLVLISGASGKYGWGDFRDPGTVPALMGRGRDLNWPPLLFYVHDEPNNEERAAGVRATFERVYAKTPQARTVTAIGEFGLEQVGHLYDVWIASLAAIDDDLIERARREDKELWAYDCRHRGQRPEFDRFVCGVWAWNSGIEGLGQWAYYGRQTLEPTDDGRWEAPESFDEWYMMPSEVGPIGTVGWEARREGIEDYRVLSTLQRLVDERGIGPDTPEDRGGRAWALLQAARAFAPADAFADSPRDARYVWEYEPWRVSPGGGMGAWAMMADLREHALEEVALLQGD